MENTKLKDIVLSTKEKNVIISIEDLRVWFELKKFGFGNSGNVRAVDGVSFNLYDRESIAIVGESGCGKTSLMKTILGLYKPKGGKIKYLDRDISEFKKKDLKWYSSQVGYVQQDPFDAIAPFMSIGKILAEPLIINGIKNKKERIKRIRQAMEDVRLTPVDDFIEKYPHMLSGGQQQRVVIARAIILEQQLLVADEPVSMLDASVRVEVLKLLEKLQQKYGLTVIYITHDLSTVRYFSERVFVMYAGKLIEKSPIDDLINDPKHPYTIALLTATSEPDSNNAKVYKEVPPGEPPSLVNPPSGCRYHERCNKKIEGLCDTKEPTEFSVGEDHLVSCWLYK